jgi:hypothetical protein
MAHRGSLSWGGRYIAPNGGPGQRLSYGMEKSHGSPASQPHCGLLTPSQMISLTMWHTSLCLKKLQRNRTAIWQYIREILLLSLVSCCVHFGFFFFDENYMWFLGKTGPEEWSENMSAQPL